jgi:uncharacterized protein with NRDE domain
MCLLLVAYRAHADYPLIVAANRDEFFRRPTTPAQFWDNDPDVLAGRDLSQGGTWMGVNKNGRFAALTNVRDPQALRPLAKSRGLIVASFLTGREAPNEFLENLARDRGEYNGFNLLVGENGSLHYFSSIDGSRSALAPGVHGLSNDRLNTPWPKVVRGKREMTGMLTRNPAHFEHALFALLSDRTVASDDELPNTGVGLEKERFLSPLFIRTAEYGTRSSTLFFAHRDGADRYVERSYNPGTDTATERAYILNAARRGERTPHNNPS